jgi:hypothetical protein
MFSVFYCPPIQVLHVATADVCFSVDLPRLPETCRDARVRSIVLSQPSESMG